MTEVPKTFRDMVVLETRPKRKSFFGKVFDNNYVMRKRGIHTISDSMFKLFCGVERVDERGRFIPELSYIWEGHSYLRNWYNVLRQHAFFVNADESTWAEGYLNIKDTTGTVIYGNTLKTIFRYYSAEQYKHTSTSLSIQVGTSDTAVSETDYKLGSRIGSGTGSGQLQYNNPTQWVFYDGSNKVWSTDVGRLFIGNTVDSVTVKEMGMCVAYTNTPNLFYIIRDLVSPAVTIDVSPDRATFHYIIEIQFSA